jgi:hypothetical protein
MKTREMYIALALMALAAGKLDEFQAKCIAVGIVPKP